MKTYVGIKEFKATPMTRGDYNKYRGWQIPKNENPADEGYLAKDEDDNGYETWVPKENFDNSCKEKEPHSLASTALNMVNGDYKERFKAEYDQLKIRYDKLKNMVNKWDKGELDFVPTCPRKTYAAQLTAMEDYLAVLEYRAHLEKVVI